jgi:threonine dehydratase
VSELAISFADVAAAHERISGHAHRTPVITSATADAMTGARLFFKCENFQRMGAFKFRGAYNAIARFSPEQKAAGVITYSSGNHAQAIALSARLQRVKSVIVMPADAPAVKVAATRAYGGDIVFYDRYKEDREALGRRLAAERGLTLIPPYDHPHVMAGQGTAAKELIEEAGALDVLAVCLGGGGLLSGCAGDESRGDHHRRGAKGGQRRPDELPQRRDRSYRNAADHRRRRADPAPGAIHVPGHTPAGG